MTPILGERKDIVERDLVTSARGAATPLVGGVRRDSVDPRSPSGKIPRRLLADVGKERQA